MGKAENKHTSAVSDGGIFSPYFLIDSRRSNIKIRITITDSIISGTSNTNRQRLQPLAVTCFSSAVGCGQTRELIRVWR